MVFTGVRQILDGVDQGTTGQQITLGDDVKLIMSTDGNTYWVYNGTTNKLELFVNSVRRSNIR